MGAYFPVLAKYSMDRETKDLLDNKTPDELLDVLLRETAKAANEIRSANNDIVKAQNRLRFAILLANRLKGKQTNGS